LDVVFLNEVHYAGQLNCIYNLLMCVSAVSKYQ